MKSRIIFTAFILLIACCLCACASAEEAAGYSVDLPDEITVGLNEFITSTYSYPTTGYVYMSIRCNDSSALSWSSSVIEKKDGITYERFSMKYLKEGQFTVTFQHQSFSKVVTVNVQEAASYVTDKSSYVIPLGETVQVQITKTGGVSYNGLKIGCYNNSNHGHFVREFLAENLILGPAIETIEHDALLAGVDELLGALDDAIDDEVFAFLLAEAFADFLFVLWVNFEPGFFDGVQNDATKIHLWDVALS